MARKTHEQFVIDANIVHNNKYEYPEEYKGNKIKIMITCPIHGYFPQRPNDHLGGHGCDKCFKEEVAKIRRSNNIEFINKVNIIHNYFYDYSKVDYINNHTKVIIICPIHGEFVQKPNHHLSGRICKECSKIIKIKKLSDTHDEFIFKANIKHNSFYLYPQIYNGCRKPLNIICPIHDVFSILPYAHLSGQGCPTCSESKGEKIIRKLLDYKNIKYITQKTFNNCKYKYKLRFDFYLYDYNCCIEYDGIQHFQVIKYFGGENEFKNRLKYDNIKNDYCINNNIKLIRIRYDEDIEQKLKENNII